MEAIRRARVRTFSYARRDGHALFRLDRGNGDWLKIVFDAGRHLVLGFDHESPISPFQVGHLWPGLYEGLPDDLRPFVLAPDGEEAFAESESGPAVFAAATFAAWWTEGHWTHGALTLPELDVFDSDGAELLLSCMTPRIKLIEEGGWDAGLVARIERHEPLDDATIRALHRDADVSAVREAMRTSGYGAPFPFAE
ncbi:Hypothetical protein I5071_54470 [Sandaracinus amylolyticus]|nr:Hypothetical protein I5071_54470 [Sandaracinus amylolyticus]